MVTPMSLTEYELRLRMRLRSRKATAIAHDVPDDPEGWLKSIFPGYVNRPLSFYHREFWDWVWSIKAGERARTFVGIWPRGAGKSTSTELAIASLAARNARRYALYICETQDQADDHVANVASLLESTTFAATYPEAGSRRLGKYGNSKGWRRNRLRTASGFTLDAIGLDTAARGIKMEGDRPDLLIFDDIDGEGDNAATTTKKTRIITRKLIPAGGDAPVVLAVQNLVIPNGIFAQLADGRADFLANRIVSGPHPAILDLETEQRNGKTVIVAGTPTWEGMGLDVCQAAIDDMGITAFRAEKQHEVEPPPGGMFDHLVYQHCDWKDVPDLVRKVVWVDPAVTDTDQSDAHGIQADGIDANGKIYRLYSWERRTSPRDVMMRAIRKAIEIGATTVGVETDQGGDTWKDTYAKAVDELVEAGELERHEAPKFASDKAGAGKGSKVQRAGQMLAAYERAEIVHVRGTHKALEAALRRFPLTKPFDLTDAAFWSWYDLTTKKPTPVAAPINMEKENVWEMGV
jgi:hypothetical protein